MAAPAKVIHVEVTGKDGPALQKFYSDIFDWKLDTDLPDGYGMARDEAGFTSVPVPGQETVRVLVRNDLVARRNDGMPTNGVFRRSGP